MEANYWADLAPRVREGAPICVQRGSVSLSRRVFPAPMWGRSGEELGEAQSTVLLGTDACSRFSDRCQGLGEAPSPPGCGTSSSSSLGEV